VRSAARLDVRLHLAELVRVRLGVVPAEEQLAALGEYGSDLCRRPATVAAVGEGQLWPGQRIGLHGGLPPYGIGRVSDTDSSDDRSRGALTFPDVPYPCICSLGVAR